MRCPHPIWIRNPAINSNVISEYLPDGTLLTFFGEILQPRIEVPCQKCIVCQENRRDAWATRMELESRSAASSFFITLTYSEEFCPDELKLLDLQNFFRRLKRRIPVRYFACGEYGGITGRPHYHSVIWLDRFLTEDDFLLILQDTWKFGFYTLRTADRNSFRYVAKYTCKSVLELPEGKQEPFAIMSRRPGIGFEFFEQIKNFEAEYICLASGERKSLPRYYLDKLEPFEKFSIKRSKSEYASIRPKLSDSEEYIRGINLERRLYRRYTQKYGKK